MNFAPPCFLSKTTQPSTKRHFQAGRVRQWTATPWSSDFAHHHWIETVTPEETSSYRDLNNTQDPGGRLVQIVARINF